jgi:hypothetical protein
MIKDKINLYKDYSCIGNFMIKDFFVLKLINLEYHCITCGSQSHMTFQCNITHLNPYK